MEGEAMKPLSPDRWAYLRTWGNPYTEPPPGYPRLLWWAQEEEGDRELDALLFLAVQKAPRNVPEELKYHYSFVMAGPLTRTKLRPPEQILQMRLAALRKRVEKKAPKWDAKWAEEEIARQIAKKPKKYSLEECRKVQEEKRELEDSVREARRQNLPPERRIWIENGVVVYGGKREIPRIDVPSDTLKWVYMSGGLKEFPDWMRPKKGVGFEEAWGL